MAASWAYKMVNSVLDRENSGWGKADVDWLANQLTSGKMDAQSLRDIGVRDAQTSGATPTPGWQASGPAEWALRQVRSVNEREGNKWSEQEIERMAFQRQSGDLSLADLQGSGIKKGKKFGGPNPSERNTARAIVQATLRDYGLDFSSSQVEEWVGLITEDPANMALVLESIRQSPEFAERFPGLQKRVDGGYNQISVQEYLQLEDAYSSIMRTTGMPSGYYDSPDDFANFIANDIDPTELESRIAQGYIAAQQAPEEMKQALREFYGIQNSDAALAAYYLDPDKALPAIEREFQSAQIAGASRQTSFGGISKAQAEQLQRLGIEEAQARAGFSNLAGQRGLLESNLGSGHTFSVDEQLDAAFRNDAGVKDRIGRQREARLGVFDGRQGGAIGNKGVVGLQDTNKS